jgi:DNA-directed RNA polymerase specialized sigma24 family protein
VIDSTRTSQWTFIQSSVPPALLARIRAAIEELPDEQRVSLTLRKGATMPYRQIADVLGCDEGEAQEATYSAIRTLQSQFASNLSAIDPGLARAAEPNPHVSPMKGDNQ